MLVLEGVPGPRVYSMSNRVFFFKDEILIGLESWIRRPCRREHGTSEKKKRPSPPRHALGHTWYKRTGALTVHRDESRGSAGEGL